MATLGDPLYPAGNIFFRAHSMSGALLKLFRRLNNFDEIYEAMINAGEENPEEFVIGLREEYHGLLGDPPRILSFEEINIV